MPSRFALESISSKVDWGIQQFNCFFFMSRCNEIGRREVLVSGARGASTFLVVPNQSIKPGISFAGKR